MIEDRDFPADGDFGAYSACEKWLEDLGCTCGSKQSGSPTAVMFWHGTVSKYRGLSQADIAATHGWITAMEGGRFREDGVRFRITEAGRKYLDAQRKTT